MPGITYNSIFAYFNNLSTIEMTAWISVFLGLILVIIGLLL